MAGDFKIETSLYRHIKRSRTFIEVDIDVNTEVNQNNNTATEMDENLE